MKNENDKASECNSAFAEFLAIKLPPSKNKLQNSASIPANINMGERPTTPAKITFFFSHNLAPHIARGRYLQIQTLN